MNKHYLAGFFDGEGTISIAYIRRWRDGRMYYAPHVSASQKTRIPLHLFKNAFGGSISQSSDGQWSWSLSGFARVSRFLDAIAQYFIVKKKAAKIMREFLATAGPQRDRAGVPKRVLAKRARLHKRLHLLQGHQVG